MPTAWCPPFIWRTGRPIHLETGGRQPSPWEGGLGLEWTRPEQGTRRGKKRKGRQSWLESLVCRLHRLVKGTLAHTTISTRHCTLIDSPRQQSRNRDTRQLPPSPSHPGGIRVCGCHSVTPLPPAFLRVLWPWDSRGHAGRRQEPGLQGQASLSLIPNFFNFITTSL